MSTSLWNSISNTMQPLLPINETLTPSTEERHEIVHGNLNPPPEEQANPSIALGFVHLDIDLLEEHNQTNLQKGEFTERNPRRIEDIMKLENPLYKYNSKRVYRKQSYIQDRASLNENKRQEIMFRKTRNTITNCNNIAALTMSKSNWSQQENKQHNLKYLDVNLGANHTSPFDAPPNTNRTISNKQPVNNKQSTTPSEDNDEIIPTKINKLEVDVIDNIIMIIMQMLNCMIKFTLIQMAYCIKVWGFVYASITICIVAFSSIITLRLWMQAHVLTGESSYLSFTERVFGHFGKFIILICGFLGCYGSCLSYIIILWKIIPNVIQITIQSNFLSNKTYISIILAIVLVYYCYHANVRGIKKIQFWGFIGMFMFVILLIVHFFVVMYYGQLSEYSIDFDWNKTLYGASISDYPSPMKYWEDVISAIACIIFSYGYHIFAFGIYDCMGPVKWKQFFTTASISVFIATLIYLIVGMFGYWLYSNNLQDSILDSIGSNFWSSLLSIGFATNVWMTFPSSFNCLRWYFLFIMEIVLTKITDCFTSIIRCICCKKRNLWTGLPQRNEQGEIVKKNSYYPTRQSVQWPKALDYLFSSCIFFSIFYIANVFPSLKLLFSLLGCTTANCYSFIWPATFYIKFSKHNVCTWKNMLSITFIIVGINGMVICLLSNIRYLLLFIFVNDPLET